MSERKGGREGGGEREVGNERSRGERAQEGKNVRERECMMDRDGGKTVRERRWSGAISVTSHLSAQCFSAQCLVRGQREREESEALPLSNGCSQVASQARALISLCLPSLREGGRTSLL